MQFIKAEGHFTTKEQALAEVASHRWHAIEKTFHAEDKFYWHDFDAVIYVLQKPPALNSKTVPSIKQEWIAGWRLPRASCTATSALIGTESLRSGCPRGNSLSR